MASNQHKSPQPSKKASSRSKLKSMTLNYCASSGDSGPLIVHKQFNTVFDKLRSKGDPLISPLGGEANVTIKNMLTVSSNNSPSRRDRKKSRKVKRDLKFQGNFVFNKNHRRAKTVTHSNTLSKQSTNNEDPSPDQA